MTMSASRTFPARARLPDSVAFDYSFWEVERVNSFHLFRRLPLAAPRLSALTAITLAALLALLALPACSRTDDGLSAPSLAQPVDIEYDTTTPRIGTITQTLNGRGIVRSANAVTPYTTIAGTIEKINVTYGDTVKKGDLLYTLAEHTDYELALKKIQQQLKTAQNDLISLKTAVDGGGDVGLAKLLWQQASYNYEQMKGSASAQALKIQELAVEHARLAYEATLESAEYQYQQALAALDCLQIEVDQAQARYDACYIWAPQAGVVSWTSRHLVGSAVSRYAQLLTISDPDSLVLSYSGTSTDRKYLDLGTQFELTFGGATYTATVTATPSTYPRDVEYNIDAADNYMYFFDVAGYDINNAALGDNFQNMTLTIERHSDILLIDTYLLKGDEGAYYVNVTRDGLTFNKPVRIGLTDTVYVEIVAGLSVDDKLVIG